MGFTCKCFPVYFGAAGVTPPHDVLPGTIHGDSHGEVWRQASVAGPLVHDIVHYMHNLYGTSLHDIVHYTHYMTNSLAF